MKLLRRCQQGLTLAALSMAALALLLWPETSASAIDRGLRICARSLLPTLFPFFVVTNLWLRLGYGAALSRAAAPLTETAFHLPGAAASALVLGAVGGYPVGARTAARLCSSAQLKKADAQRLLCFCNNAGPAFVVGIIGVGVFQSAAVGAVLYGIHLLSALLLGRLVRPSRKPETTAAITEHRDRPTGSAVFTEAIRDAGGTIIQVCVFVLFFSILTGFLTCLTPETARSQPWYVLLTGMLELAGGADALAAAPWPPQAKLCASAFLLGWGGFCVHGQTLSLLGDTGLHGGPYLLCKLAQGAVSAAMAWLLAPLLPLPAACFAVSPAAWRYPAAQLGCLLCVFLFGVLQKITTGKEANHRI